ncbi:unnamed protein product [Dracunculus medinensis]|uniref:ADF-H domain-containing protein n=1 Tax=Dracunculus medinensis TaxID=318479 RepID=A0A0N4U510_DRAME|nr:unnamed protein product [Dracunculus medinensis]
MANFACIIVYMASVAKEVGNKQYASSRMDDPLFHYSYGYSFIMLKISFLGNETAALLSVLVFMAKRDAFTYNQFRIRAFVKKYDIVAVDMYHKRTRFRSAERRRSTFVLDQPKKPQLCLTKLDSETDVPHFISMLKKPSLMLCRDQDDRKSIESALTQQKINKASNSTL